MLYFLNYVDESTRYSAGETQACRIENLQDSSSSLLKWFRNNYTKVKSGKIHIVMLGKQRVIAEIIKKGLESQNGEELLRIDIDSTPTFESHNNNIYKKSSQILNDLASTSLYMALEKERSVMKAFIASHFGYYRLVWVLNSWGLNKKISPFRERPLRVAFGDKIFSFQNLLKKEYNFESKNNITKNLTTTDNLNV